MFPDEALSRLKGKASRLEMLTKAEYEHAMRLISSGACDHAEWQYLGISPETYYVWIRRGRAAKDGMYRKFYLDVMRARMAARITAEIEVKQKDPRFWLQYGPFKDEWRAESRQIIEEEPPSHKQLVKEQQQLISTIAEGLAIMEELGFIKLNEQFKQLQQQPPALEAK
jgi:hypothetical protein